MTQAELVFDPFSQEYFENPFDIYERMRQRLRCTTTRKRISTRSPATRTSRRR